MEQANTQAVRLCCMEWLEQSLLEKLFRYALAVIRHGYDNAPVDNLAGEPDNASIPRGFVRVQNQILNHSHDLLALDNNGGHSTEIQLQTPANTRLEGD